jgi:hypothetical protein
MERVLYSLHLGLYFALRQTSGVRSLAENSLLILQLYVALVPLAVHLSFVYRGNLYAILVPNEWNGVDH